MSVQKSHIRPLKQTRLLSSRGIEGYRKHDSLLGMESRDAGDEEAIIDQALYTLTQRNLVVLIKECDTIVMGCQPRNKNNGITVLIAKMQYFAR